MTTVCALFRTANLHILDYPFDAALASAMAICNEAVVVVGPSQDETMAWVLDLAADYGSRIKIVQQKFRYDLGWQERWWNEAVRHTAAEWLLWLDADEVIDPQYAEHLQSLMAMPESPSLIRFPFVHFYATPDYQIEFTLTQNTRLGRRSTGFRMADWRSKHGGGAAACQMVYDGPDGKERNAHTQVAPLLYETPFPILHYGWCRHAHALGISQEKQRAWYADGDGLENGRIPLANPVQFKLVDYLASGRVQRWDGEHPVILQRWFDEHKWAWTCIEKRLEQERVV